MPDIIEWQTQFEAMKAMRDKRLEAGREVKEMEKQEKAMGGAIIDFLEQNPEINGLMGKTHKAILKTEDIPVIDDAKALQDYIVANDAWDLVSIRVSAPAVRDRWEDGVQIPGISELPQSKLSITKI